MGEQKVSELDASRLREFVQALLTDLQALERLLAEGRIESGVRRIGAEQELFLVAADQRAAPAALEVLDTFGDPHATTELGRFNLELNLDPLPFAGDCLRRLEGQLLELLAGLRKAAAVHGVHVVLCGILPTLDRGELTLDNMTPRPRYFMLSEALRRLRGEEFELRVEGLDELIVRHDNVMLEACNTSFQTHFQVGAEEFARLYNLAQAITAPVLAAATNSPLLFGKRLWRETRIALFQQSLDTRSPRSHQREQAPRVSFGRRWVDSSVLEIFREDVSRFRALLGGEVDEDPFAAMAAGRAPKLQALRLHNSTIYRWNRPCYGISDGVPHLRIENRALPSGPSVVDEVANAAFWLGLMAGLDREVPDVTREMRFEVARENFFAAAQQGLDATFGWLGGRRVGARELVRAELLPAAREGLKARGLDVADVSRYLDIVAERVETRRTGSQWLLDSYQGLQAEGTRGERLAALVAAMAERQADDRPVHTWEPARLEEAGGWVKHYGRIENLMTTELFTVHQDDLVDLAASLMDWRHIRHVPVEDDEHRLVGLVTYRNLLRLLARNTAADRPPIPVSEVMQRDPVTCSPQTPTLEAIDRMKTHRIACLPVVDNDRLVGIVTERDFLDAARQVFEDLLGD